MAKKNKEGWFGAKARGKRITVYSGELAPNPWNPNEQSSLIASKMTVSLDKFGIIKELLVREIGPNNPKGKGKAKEQAYQIVDGEHRWKEIREAGVNEVEVRNLGIMEDDEAKQLTVVMNELNGDPNPIKLSSLIAQLDQAGLRDDFEEIAPYTSEEVDTLLAIQDLEEPELPSSPEEKEENKPEKKAEGYIFQIGPHRGQLPTDVADNFEQVLVEVSERLKTTDTIVIVSALCKILETMRIPSKSL